MIELLPHGFALPDGSAVVQMYLPTSSADLEPPATVVTSTFVSGKGYLTVVRLPRPAELVQIWKRSSVRLAGVKLLSEYAGRGLADELTDAEYAGLPEPMREMYTSRYETTGTAVAMPLGGITYREADPEALELAPKNWRPDIIGQTMGPLFHTQCGGWLTGWRQRACEIAREYSNDVYEHLSDSSIKVHVRSFWDPPKTTTEGKGRQRRTRETWHTTQLTIDTPHLIAGHNLADAQQRWTKKEQELRDELSQYTGSRICGHCNGDGWITCPAT